MLEPERALTRLARLASQWPEHGSWIEEQLSEDLEALAPLAVAVAIAEGPVMGRALTRVLQAQPNADLCDKLKSLIPHDSVALRELAVEATSQIVRAMDGMRDRIREQLSDERLFQRILAVQRHRLTD